MGRLQPNAARHARLRYTVVFSIQLHRVRSGLRHDDGDAGLRRRNLQLLVQRGTYRLQRWDTTEPRRLRMPDAGLLLKHLPDDAREWRRAVLLRLREAGPNRPAASHQSLYRIHWQQRPVHAVVNGCTLDMWSPRQCILRLQLGGDDLLLLAIQWHQRGPRSKRQRYLHRGLWKRQRSDVELGTTADTCRPAADTRCVRAGEAPLRGVY
jgi:hypothetical protein